jgi:hypothetical protein
MGSGLVKVNLRGGDGKFANHEAAAANLLAWDFMLNVVLIRISSCLLIRLSTRHQGKLPVPSPSSPRPPVSPRLER